MIAGFQQYRSLSNPSDDSFFGTKETRPTTVRPALETGYRVGRWINGLALRCNLLR